MSITNLHTLYAVNLNTATLNGSPALFDQIQNFRISTGLQQILQNGDGAVDPSFVGIMSQKPMLRFSTTALATGLAACGLSGAVIDADGSYPGLEAWFQKMAAGSDRASGANHLKMTGAKGILVPRSLRASQDGTATLEFEAIFVYDGTLDPVVIAASQALSGSPAVGEMFTVGPVKINGSFLEGIQDITFDFGIKLITESGDGQVWPTFVGIMSREPSLRIRTTDLTALSTYGITGAAIAASDVVAFLRKIAEGTSGRVADDGGEHISLTAAQGIITVENESASQDGVGSADLVITPSKASGTDIIAISTAANIA